MLSYRRQLVAFVDILGFKSMIAEVESGRLEPEAISDILLAVRNRTKRGRRHFATNMSDSIVMSAGLHTDGLESMIASLSLLTARLLRSGIFLRGAVTKGTIFHDQNSVFGQGLIDAFKMESSAAIYPRILISEGLVNDITALRNDHLQNLIRKGRDGKHFIHVLKDLEGIKHVLSTHRQTHERRAQYLSRYVTMRDAIQRRAREALENPRHLRKVCWFARYWNSSAPKSVPELQPIEVPRQRKVRTS